MRPKKSLGQNFLKDKNIAKKIIDQIYIKNNLIIEIGAGYGFLTDFIINECPKQLYLVEKDEKLANILKKKYALKNNIFIINDDIFNIDFENFKKIKIISNLPYNISTKLLLKSFKSKQNILEMVLMVQKEIAIKFDYKNKIINKYNFLSKLCSDYKRLFNVSKNVFYPKPKVESSVIKLIFNKKIINWSKVDKFINSVFVNKRKKLNKKINIESKDLVHILEKRIDELKIEEVLKIYNFF